mgnify:CR=1 FL=1
MAKPELTINNNAEASGFKSMVFFNFEKVSKRTYLDIASVNSAMSIQCNSQGKITYVAVAAGDLIVQISNADGVTGNTTVPGAVVHTTLITKA